MTKAPDAPTDLPKRSWMDTLKRTFREFKEDNLTDWAAALTYYSVLSVFPALIALISIVGLVADPATITRVLTDTISQLGPSSAVETFKGPIEDITANSSTAGLGLILGLAGALWTASGYVGAFMRASNAIYEIEEGRPFWKLRPLQILVTLILELMLAIVVLGLIVSGPLATAIGNAVGVGDTALTIFNIAKWPLLLVIVAVMLAVLYYAAPNAKLPGFKWISPGSVLAVVDLDPRVGGVRLLRRELRLLRQDLRDARRRDHVPRLDVDHEPGGAVRRRAQRRARAQPRARGG